MTTRAETSIRLAASALNSRWGVRPLFSLACAGAADEHWQIWHPADLSHDEPMPRYVVQLNGTIEPHPDAAGE